MNAMRPMLAVRITEPLSGREAQVKALREIADLLRDRKAHRLDMLSEPDQLYCASLFLGTHRNWMDDLTPANTPELYALIPQMLMAGTKPSDRYTHLDKLWDILRRACLKQAGEGIAHELEVLGINI